MSRALACYAITCVERSATALPMNGEAQLGRVASSPVVPLSALPTKAAHVAARSAPSSDACVTEMLANDRRVVGPSIVGGDPSRAVVGAADAPIVSTDHPYASALPHIGD